MKAKKNQIETIKKVLHYLKRYRFFMFFSILFAAVSVALTLYAPILVGAAIDLIVGKDAVDFSGIRIILQRLALIIVITAVLQWLMNTINNKITYHMVKDVRSAAFEKLQILPLSYLDNHTSGEIVSRIITDVDQFADGLLIGFTQLFTGIATIIGTLFFMLTIHPGITAVVVVLTPLSLFVAKFI
ncbi:MAG: ABC transporter transmembrane domain-containing protein, partial [Acetivibrio ethanolgignens]